MPRNKNSAAGLRRSNRNRRGRRNQRDPSQQVDEKKEEVKQNAQIPIEEPEERVADGDEEKDPDLVPQGGGPGEDHQPRMVFGDRGAHRMKAHHGDPGQDGGGPNHVAGPGGHHEIPLPVDDNNDLHTEDDGARDDANSSDPGINWCLEYFGIPEPNIDEEQGMDNLIDIVPFNYTQVIQSLEGNLATTFGGVQAEPGPTMLHALRVERYGRRSVHAPLADEKNEPVHGL